MSKVNPMPDKLLVVDFACSAWEHAKDQPATQTNEIIEISVVPISLKNLIIYESYSTLIKPTKSKISKFCSNLTGITQEQAEENGISFEEACVILIEKYKSQEIPWVSYGDFDKRMLLYQCEIFKHKYPFGAGHWNFRETFAKLMGLDTDVSLPDAMNKINMDFEGKHHKSKDDAYNTARLMLECFRRVRYNVSRELSSN